MARDVSQRFLKDPEKGQRDVAVDMKTGFRRIDVSGRAELLCKLARWGFEPPVPPAQRPPSLVPGGSRRTISRGLRRPSATGGGEKSSALPLA